LCVYDDVNLSGNSIYTVKKNTKSVLVTSNEKDAAPKEDQDNDNMNSK
jgi:hypothetical protein